MTKNIRTVLTPLLIISYVCGLRIIEFPTGKSRIWFSFFYMLLFWLIYFSLFKYIIYYTELQNYNTDYYICFMLDSLVTLLSIGFGVYHDKKFRDCLRKLDIVDNTMLNVGTTTDYHKLQKKVIYLVLGWFLMIILMSYGAAFWLNKEYNSTLIFGFCALLVRNYCSYVNILNDLMVANIFGYIGLKFDQVNQLLLDLTTDRRGLKRAWKYSTHQHTRLSQTSNNEWIIWVIIHLHSELRKISCEINSIFGVQMAFKMACNFCWLTIDLRELFSAILINNYIKSNKILFITAMLIWIFQNILKLFFINYLSETVSNKANATGNLINKILYSTCDVEVRENILQLVLQITQAPVRFYGIGLFQYGYKFFYGFISAITTVVVLIVQAYITKQKI